MTTQEIDNRTTELQEQLKRKLSALLPEGLTFLRVRTEGGTCAMLCWCHGPATHEDWVSALEKCGFPASELQERIWTQRGCLWPTFKAFLSLERAYELFNACP